MLSNGVFCMISSFFRCQCRPEVAHWFLQKAALFWGTAPPHHQRFQKKPLMSLGPEGFWGWLAAPTCHPASLEVCPYSYNCTAGTVTMCLDVLYSNPAYFVDKQFAWRQALLGNMQICNGKGNLVTVEYCHNLISLLLYTILIEEMETKQIISVIFHREIHSGLPLFEPTDFTWAVKDGYLIGSDQHPRVTSSLHSPTWALIAWFAATVKAMVALSSSAT